MRRFLAIAAALALGAAFQADAQALHYAEVAIDFSIDGKTIGSPSAIVTFGEEADVTIGDPDEHAWRFRILADEPTVVRRAAVIPVSIALDEIAKGQSFPRASPNLKAVPGQRADIETILGDGDGRHVHFTIVANPKSDAEIEALRSGANPP